MSSYKTIEQIPSNIDSILLRLDLNVPLKNGHILDDTRIQKALPTILALLQKTKTLIILTHLGRPKIPSSDLSTRILLPSLEKMLNTQISFVKDVSELKNIHPEQGKVYLLENLRFFEGEEKNDLEFAKLLKGNSTIYVNDAFSCSHRAHASIEAITTLLPSYAGLLLDSELRALSQVLDIKTKPIMAIIGGSKISSKIDIINNLATKVDYLVIAGAMANTFLKAEGYQIGASLVEDEALETCRILVAKFKNLILPTDFITANSLIDPNIRYQKLGDSICGMILDFGDESIRRIETLLIECKCVLWNGPLGAYEYKPFDRGSLKLAQIISKFTQERNLISIAGGGDTVGVLKNAPTALPVSLLSTAGGAFLEYVEGKNLPGIEALKKQLP